MSRPRARAALAAALACPLLALPTAAHAQLDRAAAGVWLGAETYVNPAEGPSFSPCNQEQGGASAFDVACNFNGRGRVIGTGGVGRMQMAASGTAGGALHAYSRSYIASYVESAQAAVVRTTASYWDGIVFSGYVPPYLRVTAMLHGTASLGEAADCPPSGCGQDGPVETPGEASGTLGVLGGDWEQMVHATTSSPTMQVATFDFPVSLYWSDAEQTWYFNFGVRLTAYAWAGSGSLAVADFGNTAWIGDIRAVSDAGCDLAAAGCDVTAAVQQGGVRAFSGASYGGFAVPSTTAPEPATVALLGAGLAALGAAAGRARQRRPA